MILLAAKRSPLPLGNGIRETRSRSCARKPDFFLVTSGKKSRPYAHRQVLEFASHLFCLHLVAPREKRHWSVQICVHGFPMISRIYLRRSLHLVLENGSTVFSIVSTSHARAYYSTIHGHESTTTCRSFFHRDIRYDLCS